jgi:biotin carboxylase
MWAHGRAINAAVPPTSLVRDMEDIKRFEKNYNYPFIIKPVDSTMSRGFKYLNDSRDVTEEVLEKSRSFSKTNQIIIQTFMPGDMVTLEGVCSGGKHKTLAAGFKKESFKVGITSGVEYPADFDPEMLDYIIKENDRYVESSGLSFGLTHAEYIVAPHAYWLLEIGARGGGAGITDKIVPWVSGVDVYDILHRSLMGEVVDVKALRPLNRHASLRYYERHQPINWEDNTDKIMEVSGVAEYRHNFLGEQYVSDPYDTRYSMGIYLAEDEKGMEEVMRGLDQAIC